MANKQTHYQKFHKKIELTAGTGVKGDSTGYKVYGETTIRVTPTGVGGTNVVDIEGRLETETTWTSIGSVTGTTSDTFDISTYDYIRFNQTTSDGTGEVIVSGFFNQVGSLAGAAAVVSFTTIQADAGTNPVADSSTDTLTFTSSDASVTITGNSTTDTVNFTVAGGSGDVVGPASSTDNAIARFDSTTGKLIQNSLVTIDDSGRIAQTALSGSTYLGVGAGASDDLTSNNNVGIGVNANGSVTTGTVNTAIGHNALNSNTTASHNIGVGSNALGSMVGNAIANIGIGTNCGTTINGGDYNIGVGVFCNSALTTGLGNITVGYSSYSGNTGSDNITIGRSAHTGAGNRSTNIVIGYTAGTTLTTGSSNILIGTAINAPTATTSNYLNIGNLIEGDLTNGNLGIGLTDYASGVGVISIGNGTAPSGTPTGGGVLYVESGALKFKGSSGTITTIATA